MLSSLAVSAGSGVWVWAIFSYWTVWARPNSVTHLCKMAPVRIGQYHVPPFATPGANFPCMSVLALWTSNTNVFAINILQLVLTSAYSASGVVTSGSSIPDRVTAGGTLHAFLPISCLGVFAAVTYITAIDPNNR